MKLATVIVGVLASVMGRGQAFTITTNSPTGAGLQVTKLFASSMTMANVREKIDNLTKETFSTTLEELEPYLLNDAGSSIYAKSMRRIGTRAKLLGVDVPTDYAKAAKATEKRRTKQDAFIQAKEEERLAAEAEAAEAAAAEAEVAAAEEDATPVEEEIPEPVDA